MPTKAQSKVTTDHGEISRWAEERKAKPACVRGTGSKQDVGMIRLDFPGYSGETSLQPISWDEWFKKFDEHNLALLHQDTTASGEKSNFNKLVSRETAEENGSRRTAQRSSSKAGSRSGSKSRSASSSRSGSRSSSGKSRSASASVGSRSARKTSSRSRSGSSTSSSSSRSRTKKRASSR